MRYMLNSALVHVSLVEQLLSLLCCATIMIIAKCKMIFIAGIPQAVLCPNNYHFEYMCFHLFSLSLAHTHTTLLTILSRSANASPTRSRSCAIYYKYQSLSQQREWGTLRRSEGKLVRNVWSEIQYSRQYLMFSKLYSTVYLILTDVPCETDAWLDCLLHWKLHSSTISHNVCLCVVLQCVCGHMLKCLCIC